LVLGLLIIIIPVATFLVAQKLPVMPQVFVEYPADSASPSHSPSISPSPSASVSPGLTIKATFQGLPIEFKNAIAVTLSAKNTDWTKVFTLNSDGTFTSLDLTGLDTTKTYDFILWGHPFLQVKKTIDLSKNPQTVDFGELKTGDLDKSNQVNSLDWSLMVQNYQVDNSSNE